MATKAEQIEQLRRLFANVGGGWTQGKQGYDTGMGGDNGPMMAYGYVNPEFERIAKSIGLSNPTSLVGQYGFNPIYENAGEVFDPVSLRNVRDPAAAPSGYAFTAGAMADPDPGREGKRGAYSLLFNPDGSLRGVDWQNYELSKGFFGDNMHILGPLLVGGLAALGGGLAGGAAQAGGAASGLTPEIMREIAYGAIGELPGFGAGTALSAGALGGEAANALSQDAMREIAYGAIGETPGYGAMQAATAAGGGAAAGGGILETMKAVAPYAQLAGPAMSLLSGGAQLGSLPQAPEAPRIPGIEAPPEARGYQAGVAPILDVLGRNQRDGRNRTLLTGPRGVSMESVRARGNTLLGM